MSAAPFDLSAGLVPAPSIDLSAGLVPKAEAAPQDPADYHPPVPTPSVNMRPISPKEAITGKVDPMLSGQAPDASQATVPNYGQDALPAIGKGAKELFTSGKRMQGATDILHGVNDALGSSILPVGAAPAAVIKGLAGSVAGSYLAPKIVQKLGGSQQAQDLAREAGAALPLAAGVGADLVRGEHGAQPEYTPKPVEPNAEYPNQPALPAPAEATAEAPAPITHPSGKVTGIDARTKLPLVDLTQPSEALTATGDALPPQTGTAGPMSPEAEQISKTAQERALNGSPVAMGNVAGSGAVPPLVINARGENGAAIQAVNGGLSSSIPDSSAGVPAELPVNAGPIKVDGATGDARRGDLDSGVVKPPVLSAPGKQLQVDNSVVTPDAINVMHDLSGQKGATDLSLHDRPVLQDGAAPDPKSAIPSVGNAASPQAVPVALTGAKLRSLPKRTAALGDGLSALRTSEVEGHNQDFNKVGTEDKGSGRVIVQPSTRRDVNQELATAGMPEFEAGIKSAIQDVPGAVLHAVREEKNPARLDEKVEREGQPPRTITDYGAAQIAVDSPADRDAVVAQIKKRFPVVSDTDEFLRGDPDYGFRHHTLRVQVSNGATEELQIVPREVMEANKAEHHLYKSARRAEIDGSPDFKAKAAKAKEANDAAMTAFEARNSAGDITAGLVPKPTGQDFNKPPANTVDFNRPALAKGQSVTLKSGEKATIAYVDPNLRIARIRTADGTNRTVNQKDIVSLETKADRDAQIARLREQHSAVLATPLMSEGSVSPAQLGMMSSRQQERYRANAQKRMEVESQIRDLSRTDEQIEAERKRLDDKAKSGRIAQLERRIQDLGTVGVSRATGRMRPTYQREIDAAKAELETLKDITPEAPLSNELDSSKEMAKATDNAELEKWFGRSKVVDENGKPLTVYHGTNKDFAEFSGDRGFHFGTKEQAAMRTYGKSQRLIAAHLRIEKPLRVRDNGSIGKAEIQRAKRNKSDGLVYLNRYEGISPEAFDRARAKVADIDKLTDTQFKKLIPEAHDSYMALSPSQIRQTKEATNGSRSSVGNAAVDGRGNEQEIAKEKEGAIRPSETSSIDRQGSAPEEELVGAGASKSSGTKLYSGTATFDPEAWAQAFPSAAERFKQWTSDAPSAGDEQRQIMRQTRGQMDRSIARMAKQLEIPRKAWGKRGKEDSLAFFDAIESGKTDTLPEGDRKLAEAMRQAFDKQREELQELKPDALRDFIENYFPHIWDNQSKAASAFKAVMSGRRPFQGSGSFLKQRTIPTIKDGVELGLKPVSWNPVDLFLAKYHEINRYLMAHKTLDMMKEAETAKFVRVGEKAPDGWQQLDDRIGTVQSKADDGGLVIRGHYYAAPDAAKVFNNYVSRGIAGRSSVYDTLMKANNSMNSMQLGLSAFHATTTAVNAVTSDIALGIQQLSQGKVVEAGKSLAKGVTMAPSVASTLVQGIKVTREYLEPGSYKELSRLADAISDAGGRVKQNPVEIKPFTQFLSALRTQKWNEPYSSSAGRKLAGAAIDIAARPIMDFWVPRIKVGAFANMAKNILDTSDREGWSQERTRARMQTAWNSVDNRFGQMVYDNLFWNKAVRDALMFSTRSVGWNAGSAFELGGGIKDTVRQGAKLLADNKDEAAGVSKGEEPGASVTDRMAFTAALPIATALMGASVYYMLNGKKPERMKDYFFPKKADGTRLAMPGYLKDVVAFAHDPQQTIKNKMSPVLNAFSELLANHDFYNTEIRHPDDNYAKQALQVAEFLGKQLEPFAVRSFQQQRDAGGNLGTSAIAGALGFQPAAKYIQNSPAVNLANEYASASRPFGTRTQEEADRAAAKRKIEIAVQQGKYTPEMGAKMVADGQLTKEQVARARVTARLTSIERATRNLSLDQALNVYAVADEGEKKELRPVIARKAREIQQEPDKEKREALRQRLHDALHGNEAPPAANNARATGAML